MLKIAVIDRDKKVLEPCHPAVARRLLKQRKAAVFKRYPFTLILKRSVAELHTTDYTLSVDPGSRCTGLAILDHSNRIVQKIELHHRSKAIKKRLSDRAGYRRSRRTRKLRYRPPRFNNRARKAPVLTDSGWEYKSFGQSSEGWIAPSLMSRVFNIETWVRRLERVYPITRLAVEHVKFDTEKMAHPEIEGVAYQQGDLYDCELWEYLLAKFGRKCFYCGAKKVRLEKDHVIPRAKAGLDRSDNIVVCCRPCNEKKGGRHPNEIEGEFGRRVQSALRAAKKPMRDAQAVNTIRWKISETLKHTGMPLYYGTGGQTRHNRKQAGLPKTHYYDAASVHCVPVDDTPEHPVLAIHAVGYGHRGDLGDFQTVQTAPGFLRPYTRVEQCSGFAKLDIVVMQTRKGKVVGCINSFDKTAPGCPQNLRVKHDWTVADGRVRGQVTQLRRIQRRDGYAYQQKHQC